ncbi:MAG: hypothetical protein ACKO5N_07035 [Sphingomonadales bacterium]
MKIVFLLLVFLLAFKTNAQWTCATATTVSTPGTFSSGVLTGSGASQVGASAARWYKFTPATNGMLQISSCAGGADTRLWIWTGSCAGLQAVANNDDFPNCISTGTNEYASRIQNLILVAGITYYFEWDNYWESTGFTWSFSFGSLPNNNDIGIESVLNPYTRIPISQGPGGIVLGAKLKNFAATTQTAVALVVEVFEMPNTSTPVATFSSNPQTLPVGTALDFIAGIWQPNLSLSKTYQIKYSKTQPTLDGVGANDQQVQTLVLDYNYLARDNGVYAAAFNWSTVSDYVQATKFTLNTADQLTGIRYYLQSPSTTQYYHIQLYNVQGNVLETSPFWESPAILANGAGWKTYGLPSSVLLPAGTYAIGIYKSGNSPFPVGCATSQFRTGASYIRVGANNWNPIEAYSLQYVFMLRPKFGPDPPIDVAIIDHQNPGGNFTVVSTRQHPNGTPLNFSVSVQNNGVSTATNVSLKVTVKNTSQQVIHTQTSTPVDIIAGQLTTLVLPAYTITQVGSYTIDYEILNPGDAQPINNFVSTTFTRSTNQLAKHIGVQGGVGIGNNISSAYDNGIIGQCYQLTEADVLDSVRFVLRPGTPANQPVRVQIFATNTQGIPTGNPLAQSVVFTTTAAHNVAGVTLSLALVNGSLNLSPGIYFIGITEQAGLLQLGSSSLYYQPNRTFKRWNQNPYGAATWTPLEQFNQFVALAITPIFRPCLTLTANASVQAPTCGQNNGSISFLPSGFSGQVTYTWQPNAPNTAFNTNLSPGSYACLLIDENNCQLPYTTLLAMSSTAPQLTLDSVVHLDCFGTNSGQLHFSATGGMAPYSFALPGLPPQPSGIFMALGAGTYFLSITDANNCVVQQTTIITQPAQLQLSGTSLQVNLCHGDSAAVYQLQASGGLAPYAYYWPALQEDSVVQSGLPAGSYTAQVTDANACVSNLLIQITAPAPLDIIQISQVNCSCFGGSNGALSVIASGGTGGYTYNWLGMGLLGNQQSNLQAGTYQIVVQDQNGCTDSLTSIISAPPLLQLQISSLQHPNCFGQASGAVSFTTTGGTAPYAYQWQSFFDIQGAVQQLAAGTYTCSVTDANLCSSQINVTLVNPPAIQAQLLNVLPATCGQANGSLQIQTSGGTGPLNAVWNNNQIGNTLQNINAGAYQVSIADNAGCQVQQSYVVPSIGGPLLSLVNQTQPSCHNATDGQLTISASASAPIQNIVWVPTSIVAQGGLQATNLSAGTYTCTVTDNNNCTSSIVLPLSAPAALALTVQSINQVSCAGQNNGSVTVLANGGTAPYTYNWPGLIGTTNQQTGLAAGLQTCIVSDNNGCLNTLTIQITAPAPLVGLIQMLQAPTCNYSSNGILQAQAQGGTAPYTYLWNNNQQTQPVFLNASTAQQLVLVTDALGCSDTALFVPNSLSNIASNQQVIPETCSGDQNGQISLNPSGGVGPYQVTWSNGQQGLSIQNLTPGSYQAILFDQLGCLDSIEVNITSSSNLSAVISGTQVICSSAQNGSIEVTPLNGVGPFQLTLNGVEQANLNPENLASGNYSIVLTDSFNCIDTSSFYIAASNFEVQNMVQPALCLGFNNGIVYLEALNGLAPYTYSWPGYLETTDSLIGLPGGFVSYQVTDAMNCTILDSVFIPYAQVLNLSAIISPELFGSDGAIDLLANGANAPYFYNWSSGQQSEDLSGLNSGWYSVSVSDQVGCMAVDSFYVDSQLGISGKENGFITIYPNPFSNDLTICGAQINLLEIFDARGVKVTSYAPLPGEQITKLNLGFLPSGVYELRCLQYEAQLQFMILKM